MPSTRELFTKTIEYMEPFINNKEQHESQSQFCDTLMNVTGAVGNLKRLSDCAIVLCADGRTVSSRQCGLYSDVLNMVYVKMLHDDSIAKLIVEAAMKYSRHLQEPETTTEADDIQAKENEKLIDFS